MRYRTCTVDRIRPTWRSPFLSDFVGRGSLPVSLCKEEWQTAEDPASGARRVSVAGCADRASAFPAAGAGPDSDGCFVGFHALFYRERADVRPSSYRGHIPDNACLPIAQD